MHANNTFAGNKKGQLRQLALEGRKRFSEKSTT